MYINKAPRETATTPPPGFHKLANQISWPIKFSHPGFLELNIRTTSNLLNMEPQEEAPEKPTGQPEAKKELCSRHRGAQGS